MPTDKATHRTLALLLLALVAGACSREAEPRWLVRALPGSYPEIVYFVPTRAQAMALTIDDGLDPETTPAILDVLHAHGATATFFLVSDSLPGREALIGRILAEGHEVGHHMTEDETSVRLPDAELTAKFNEAADAFETVAPIVWFRAGGGRYDDRILALTRARHYRIAMASVAPLDTIVHNPDQMAHYIAWMVEPGSVVVLHDVGGRGARTAETLKELLPVLAERGFSVLSLSALDSLAVHDDDHAVSD